MKINQHYILSIFFLFAIAACNNQSKKSDASLQPALDNKYYGGILRINENEFFRSIYPLNITEVGGHRIANQVYEGLVTLSQKDLSVLPSIAESWEVDESATLFTFHIRKGVFYHDDPCFSDGKGRAVNAHDFKYVFTRLCQSDVNNQGSWIFDNKVKGCRECLEKSAANKDSLLELSGVKVIDDYTLQIELEKPFASFLHLLALPFTYAIPKEAVEKYGNEMRAKAVGTGPFIIKAIKEDDVVILTRNPNYWGKDEAGNKLPYLDGVKLTYIKDRKAELLEFTKDNLDLMYRLPLEMTHEIVDVKNDTLVGNYKNFELQTMSSLSVGYYGFQHQDKIFSNKDVRIAFNYAIDRKKICEFTLKGSGIPAEHGFVPPGINGYSTKAVNGFDFNPEKARKHLAMAGYPEGKNFPEITLQINSGGGTNEQVAEAVQKMLQENLNINISINQLPFPQHLENYETGKALFWRAGWIADYPDPENFLNLFWSVHIPEKLSDKSYLNSVRYRSDVFDNFFTDALQTTDNERRNLLFLSADQTLIDDAAVMPIFYNKDYRLLQKHVKNLWQNAMEYRNFREVYFVPPTQ